MKNRKLLLLAALALLLAGPGELRAGPQKREGRPSPLADSMRPVRKAPSAETRAAFRKFAQKQGKGWRVRYNPRTGLPEAITGGKTSRYPGTPEQAALAFFEDNKELLKVQPSALRLVHQKKFMGVTHLQYQQYKDGVPVEFSYARVHVSDEGLVSGYQGKFEPELPLETVPAVSEQAAVAAALADAGRQLRISRTELVIYPDEAAGELKLAWKLRGRGGGLWVYYVSALDGSILFKYDDLRYACAGVWPTYGTSTGKVYAVSPLPIYSSVNSFNMAEPQWTQPVIKNLSSQYFWVNGYSSMTVTNANGDYCLQQSGKVFSSLKGPYFAVTNFRGSSAHFDNGNGQWRTPATPVSTPNPYSNNSVYDYSVTIPAANYSDGVFAKVLPRFSAFNAGYLDTDGTVLDEDEVYVRNGDATVGAYIGRRTTAFNGASVENPTYGVRLESDASGVGSGFSIDISSYLVLTAAPGSSDNPTGSVLWSTSTARVFMDTSLGGANGLSEVNAFYHLNAIKDYFTGINKDHYNSNLPPANLNGQVPVMVHAHGEPDDLTGCTSGCTGMLNAYYDLEKGHILLGDGRMDNLNPGNFRSFALDGTIVRHEYIHLVIDRIYPIINFGEFGAISEALADFFAMASFWREGYDGSPYANQITLGYFVGAGEGAARDISGSGQPTGLRVMPADWWGEVHEDGQIVSQALYKLGNPNASADYYLGNFTAGTFAGRSKAEVLLYSALFYFPDNFANLHEALLDACSQVGLWTGECGASDRLKINAAFAAHGISAAPAGGDAYEASAATAFCETNNGPECASDISSLSSLSATVFPLGDVDYYSLPLPAGDFKAVLSLPESSNEGIFNAYSLFLFDSNREYVAEAVPPVYGTGSDVCNLSGPCYTLANTVTLNHTGPVGGGRYYLVVAGAPNQYYGNSEANSSSPYTLTLTRTQQGTSNASLYSAVYDNDEFSFDVPYPYFPAAGAVSSSTLTNMGGAELEFAYAQLRDHNYAPISRGSIVPGACNGTETNQAGTCMALVAGTLNAAAGNTDALGRRLVSGRVRLQPGFSARYPGVGTVYLEIFGRNRMGHLLSLGVSNPLNLTANRSEVTAYNNIIGDGGKAIIKYETQSAGSLSIKVYTLAGTLVKTVYDGPVPAGRGTVDWDGTNSGGGKAASGIYFVKTKGPGLDKVVKVAIVR